MKFKDLNENVDSVYYDRANVIFSRTTLRLLKIEVEKNDVIYKFTNKERGLSLNTSIRVSGNGMIYFAFEGISSGSMSDAVKTLRCMDIFDEDKLKELSLDIFENA